MPLYKALNDPDKNILYFCLFKQQCLQEFHRAGCVFTSRFSTDCFVTQSPLNLNHRNPIWQTSEL